MIPEALKFGAAALLTLACALPAQQAAAQDPIAGGILGGVAGGLLGGAIGGRGGAVAGAIIGGTTGAAIAAQGQRRANGYYWYNNGCYIQRPDGAWMVVAPQYCGGPVVVAPPTYGPPPVAPAAVADDDDEVEYIQQILRHGTGADRQLVVWEQSGHDYKAVVDYIVAETHAGL